MSIDMAQFHQVFFEESFEGLDIMEGGLMELEPGAADAELVNSIFRAAHSIKGGSGTFGFSQIAEFTHVMETLLDEMRDGKREVTRQNTDVLLGAVDCLKEMLESALNGDEAESERVQEQQQALERELGSGGAAEVPAATDSADTQAAAPREFHIRFKPHPGMLQTANDPLPILDELRSLGELEVEVDNSELPAYDDLDPEASYLAWNMVLRGDVSEEQLREVFAWVDDLSDLTIEAREPQAPTALQSAAQSPGETLPVPQRRSEDRGEPRDDRRQDERRKQERRGSSPGQAATSIRVETNKIDSLINMVGELVITQSMLGMVGEKIEENQAVNAGDIDKMVEGLKQLERNTRELQESVMQVRMMPISFSYSRFPRLVRDLSAKLGKKIDLELLGETTEVDKTVIEKIGDPLVHLVRNSLDHGIEMPQERVDAGKPETGTIQLNAYHQGGNIIIEIKDDGRGMDRDRIFAKAVEKGLVSEDDMLSDKQVFELIFMPGFSTAEQVSDVSGRGVGMDVVRRNIHELGGGVEIDSKLGVGTTMMIRLPLTLAILDGQTVRVGDENYIIPIISIVESIQVKKDMLNRVGADGEVFQLREEYLPIIKLHQVFSTPDCDDIVLEDGLLVVVEANGTRVGLFVDDLLGQQQVVIKSLESHYKKVEGFSGATILGDGSVALILDIPGILRLNKTLQSKSQAA